MLNQAKTLLTILWIGLVAGTLDIADNLIFNAFRGITPAMVFRFIASGLIGVDAARSYGMVSVALGVAIHFFIALFWTFIFYLVSRKIDILLRRPVLGGLVYGAFVYLFMNFVALPLSRVPSRPAAATLPARINAVLAILLFIGLTISLLVRRNLPAPKKSVIKGEIFPFTSR
jgi:hypothetical protein